MQIDDHITSCPALRSVAGLEPYPQPSVTFSATPTGTVQVRIYDFGVQPPVELTSTALSGAELTAPSLTGLSDNYTLDMGHANVTAVIDAEASEGLECVVMFEDSGGTGEQRFVKVTCNTAEHVALLYPDDAIKVDTAGGTTSTTFPSGSIAQPCLSMTAAGTVANARGFKHIDVSGARISGSGTTIDPSTIGTLLQGKIIFARDGEGADFEIGRASTAGDVVDTSNTGFVNVGLRCRNGGIANGGFLIRDGFLLEVNIASSATKTGFLSATNCTVYGPVYSVNSGSGGPYAFVVSGCTFPVGCTFDGAQLSASIELLDCTGPATFANCASKTITITGHKGMPTITLAASTSGNTFVATGALAGVTDNGISNSLSVTRLAGFADLFDPSVDTVTLTDGSVTSAKFAAGAIDNAAIAAGAITATEAPALANLDAAVSTRATQAQVATEIANYDAATGAEAAAIFAAIGSLNDLDSAAAQAAAAAALAAYGAATAGNVSTSEGIITTAIAGLPDSAAVQTAAEAAITAQEPIAANVTQVASGAVSGVADFRADVSSLATAAALALVQASADAAARAGDAMTLTTGERTAIATAVHGLPVYWAIDGGAGNATIDYSSDYPAQVRLRGWIDNEAAATNATYGAADDADGEDLRYVLSGTQVSGKAYASQWRKTGTSA